MIGAVLRRHLPATDPLARYADALDDPALAGQVLRGYLNGSIDAVLRISDRDADPLSRGRLQDQLAGPARTGDAEVGDYTPARMTEAMINAHYPLQALLYSVALHRLLRWRQPGYDPDATSAASLTCSSGAWPGRTRRGSTGCPAGCSAGARRRPWCRTVDLLDGGGHETPVGPAAAVSPVHGARAAGRVQCRRGAGCGRRAHRRGHRPDRPGARRAGTPGPGAGRPGPAERFGLHRSDRVCDHGFDESETRMRPGRAALAGRRLAGGLRGQPAWWPTARTSPAAARCGSPTACSTWSATGSRRSRSAEQLQQRFAAPPPAVD